MPAKRKITIKKKAKVEEPKIEEVKEPVIEEETPVSTVVEREIIGTKSVESKKVKEEVIGEIWWTPVAKPKGRIKFEAQVAPYPMFKLPEDVRRYLINNWLTSDVYKKDKEWLEKHNVDMKMVEKLKQFLTEVL